LFGNLCLRFFDVSTQVKRLLRLRVRLQLDDNS
jgi:hypothetical protein